LRNFSFFSFSRFVTPEHKVKQTVNAPNFQLIVGFQTSICSLLSSVTNISLTAQTALIIIDTTRAEVTTTVASGSHFDDEAFDRK
jgi:hypothetical protein